MSEPNSVTLCCPSCSRHGGKMPPILERNEENKSYYCHACGIEWSILIFDTDAKDVIEQLPFILEVGLAEKGE